MNYLKNTKKLKSTNMPTREDWKTYQGVFDKITFEALYRMHPKYFDKLLGPVSTGKEADVYLAEKDNGYVALKIYRVLARDYHGIKKYINDDPRFSKVKNNPRSIIFTWCQKEFKNLTRMSEVGVRVPEPIRYLKNVLLMEFIGTKNKASPLAKYQPPENPEEWKNIINEWIKNLWIKAGMVHGDLSEWNIINHNEKPVIIDVSQAVLKAHPLSLKLLKRDVDNMTRWFNQLGVNNDSLIEWFNKVKTECTNTNY